MTKFNKGDLVKVQHSRSGTWNGMVQADFDDEVEEFPAIAVAEGSVARGMNTEWGQGECPPCRKGLCKITKSMPIRRIKPMEPIKNWGKDHWSMLAYLETLAVEHEGIAQPDPSRMRTNRKTHAGTGGGITPYGSEMDASEKYPTKLKKGELKGHDDWDCAEDLAEAGFLESIGSGVNPAYTFTDKGRLVTSKLREHKMSGGVFHNFNWIKA